jgi:hypothetical protein
MFYIISHFANVIFYAHYLMILMLSEEEIPIEQQLIAIVGGVLFLYNFSRIENGLNAKKYFDERETSMKSVWAKAAKHQ